MKTLLVTLTLMLALASGRAWADTVDDYHHLQRQLDSTILDIYEGSITPTTPEDLRQGWLAVVGDLTDPAAKAMAPTDFSYRTPDELAAKIGASRATLQHVAALEMLAQQRAGNVIATQTWRDVITLPQFANADDGGLLLQQPADQVRSPATTAALAKEYVGWEATRTRQLMDHFQRALSKGEADETFIQSNVSEVRTLSHFPPALLQAAGIKDAQKTVEPLSTLAAPYDSPATATTVAAWREQIETTLPNLLSNRDVTRLQRLLARFVDVIPKEYRNGVQDGKIIIPLEYNESVQFTQQAQGLVNELAPVWRRDRHDAYVQYHGELAAKLATLQKNIDEVKDLSVIEGDARDVGSVLGDRFGLSAREAGDKNQIIEETAFDVRDNLNNSLAAAQAGHWREAESLRLDAYTAFDTEIEVRVMPRNPGLAMKTERSFIDGQDEPGIKALLDRGASMPELTAGYARALKNLEECVGLLKVAVSPQTIGFTAFTILAREGLEAIVILAALLAGLRGLENLRIRRGIVAGALLGLGASALTFWLSQTIVRSLVRYGEKLEAIVSVLAVIILLMVTNWVFHKMYWVGWNAKLRGLSKEAQEVRAPGWELFALLGVGFLTVYREGFETTIFMQSLILEGSTSSVLLGVGAGFLFIAAMGALIFLFGAKLPYRKLLVFTGVLVVSIMVTFFGSGVRLFQTVGWLPVHPIPHLNFPNWVGTWLGLYPSWEGLLIPPLALVYVGGAWLYTKLRAGRVRAKNSAAAPHLTPLPGKPSRSTVSV